MTVPVSSILGSGLSYNNGKIVPVPRQASGAINPVIPVGMRVGACGAAVYPTNNQSSASLSGAPTYAFYTYLMVSPSFATVSDFEIDFANYFPNTPNGSAANGNNVEAIGANPITVGVAIALYQPEVQTSNYFPGVPQKIPSFVNNMLVGTINPGEICTFKVSGAEMKPGSFFNLRVFVQVASAGQVWPLNKQLNSSKGDGISSGTGTPATNYLAGGSIPAANGYGFLPSAVRARANSLAPSVFIIGDSRTYAVADGQDSQGNQGYTERALMNNYGHASIGVFGQCAFRLAQHRIYTSQNDNSNYSHAFVNLGINDILQGQTLSNIQTNLTAIYGWNKARGRTVFGYTIEPSTTSTDGWVTNDTTGGANNQTPTANMGNNSIRTQLNDWIRAGAPLNGVNNIDGYFEVADTLESSRNSGYWAVGAGPTAYTNDGLHANQAGNLAAVPAITSKLSLVTL